MRALIFTLLLLLLGTPLFAQEEEAVDLAVAFPNTTLVYMRIDTGGYFEALNPEELFAGVEDSFDLPDLGELARDRLELNLSDEEVNALAQGVKATGLGLLDIGVSGPKVQVVFQHEDLAALARALKEAEAAGAATVPAVEDYYGTLIYELELPLMASDPGDNLARNLNPFASFMAIENLWVSVFKDRYLLISSNGNAVKDAVDYISFPEDPMDTLLGNSRYKEAIKPFVDPQAVFFVNVQAVINTMERLAGDKGSSGPMQEMLKMMLGTNNEQVSFFFGLVQYEQFKSFAAAFWIDEEALTLRMDANLVFHNPPGWFEAVRIDPRPMPLTTFIPGDAMFAVTNCVQDVGGMYERVKEFFFARANAAGQAELVEGWEEIEREIQDEQCSLKDALDRLGYGQAFLVLPSESDNASTAGILGLKNRKQGEDFFYDTFLNSKLGEAFRAADGEITPITVIKGVEIHHNNANDFAYAFMDADGDAGVFVIGELDAVRRVVEARLNSTNLQSKASWQAAKDLLYEQGSLHMYVNFGSILNTMGRFSRYWMWEEEDNFDRDDTEKDEDAIPYLAKLFNETIFIGSARSNESSVNVRVAAAGWPDRDEMRATALHFRDVERNRIVRDDFLRVRDASRAHFAIKGKPATEIAELVNAGVLAREDWGVDPFGADEDDGKAREYALAEVPEDVDIKQAILCAYQREPGLRGNHLAILWNSHVVELTPEALINAIALAKQGKPLPPEGDWYRNALRPLYEMDDPRDRPSVDRWFEDDRVDVVIIDDEGNEQTVKLDDERLMEDTEEVLDQQDAKED